MKERGSRGRSVRGALVTFVGLFVALPLTAMGCGRGDFSGRAVKMVAEHLCAETEARTNFAPSPYPPAKRSVWFPGVDLIVPYAFVGIWEPNQTPSYWIARPGKDVNGSECAQLAFLARDPVGSEAVDGFEGRFVPCLRNAELQGCDEAPVQRLLELYRYKTSESTTSVKPSNLG
jgi:hypothetical protein